MKVNWGRVAHICVSDLTIIGSDNDLSLSPRQTIIRTNAGILLIRPLRTNFSEVLIEILIFSFKKRRLKVSSAKRRPFCIGLNVLKVWCLIAVYCCSREMFVIWMRVSTVLSCYTQIDIWEIEVLYNWQIIGSVSTLPFRCNGGMGHSDCSHLM